ncbi:hypothetical protein, partial [Streptomyces doebereineriae]
GKSQFIRTVAGRVVPPWPTGASDREVRTATRRPPSVSQVIDEDGRGCAAALFGYDRGGGRAGIDGNVVGMRR